MDRFLHLGEGRQELPLKTSVVIGVVVWTNDDDEVEVRLREFCLIDHRPDLTFDEYPSDGDAVFLPHRDADAGMVEGSVGVIDREMRGLNRLAMMDDPIEFAMRFDRVDLLHGLEALVGEADAAFGAASSEDLTTGSGGRAGTESSFVRVFFLGRLIGFLSHNEVLLCF